MGYNSGFAQSNTTETTFEVGEEVEQQQVTVQWKKASDDSNLETRKCLLTKIGTQVTMQLEPMGTEINNNTPVSCGASRVYSDAFIPEGWRPALCAEFQWTVNDNPMGDDITAFARVNQDGTVEVALNPAFANFAGNLSGYYSGLCSWNTTELV